MAAYADLVRGVALVVFAAGALLITVGDRRRGFRAIAFSIVLVAVEPLILAGLSRLHHMEVPNGIELNTIVLVLFLAVVLLAGLVALRRTRSGGKSADATSQKKRVERAP